MNFFKNIFSTFLKLTLVISSLAVSQANAWELTSAICKIDEVMCSEDSRCADYDKNRKILLSIPVSITGVDRQSLRTELNDGSSFISIDLALNQENGLVGTIKYSQRSPRTSRSFVKEILSLGPNSAQSTSKSFIIDGTKFGTIKLVLSCRFF